MSLFKRLSATLFSRIDQVVGEIEDHDAVVQATLTDMRKKVAEAKIRLKQVHREEDRLQQLINQQTDNAERWRQRAVQSAKMDEGKALECVSRHRQCQRNVERLNQSLAQYQQTAEKLANDIQLTEQRLQEVKQKLTLMRARQSTTSALHATGDTNQEATQLLEDTFDRWEINISQAELAIDDHEYIDVIEREFVQSEQEAELREDLATLLAEEE